MVFGLDLNPCPLGQGFSVLSEKRFLVIISNGRGLFKSWVK